MYFSRFSGMSGFLGVFYGLWVYERTKTQRKPSLFCPSARWVRAANLIRLVDDLGWEDELPNYEAACQQAEALGPCLPDS